MDLKTWMSVSHSRSNAIALGSTAVFMAALFFMNHGPLENVVAVRRAAMIMMTVHAMFHAASIFSLRSLALRGMQDAALALSHYRHPYRVSHLDLSVAWIGLFSLAPYLA